MRFLFMLQNFPWKMKTQKGIIHDIFTTSAKKTKKKISDH